MKPEVSPVRAPYRNEIVYGSAQRLIASRPSRPQRARPTRALVFLLGVTCGLSLAAFLLWPKRATTTAGDKEQIARAFTYPNRKRPTLWLPTATTASAQAAAPAPTSILSDEDASMAPALASTESSAPDAISERAAPSRVLSTTATNATFGAVTTPTTILTRFTTSFKLHGELRSMSGKISQVEFEFFLSPDHLGGFVQGSVRFLDHPTALPLKLSGRWVNRTFTLRETAYSFVIEFPATAESNDITGYWTGGGTSGNLVLQSVSPL